MQTFGLFGLAAADSIVVFGSVTEARLSHDRTALAFAIAGFGVVMAGPRAGPPGPPPGGTAPRPPPRPP
jgi:hypothetical protein